MFFEDFECLMKEMEVMLELLFILIVVMLINMIFDLWKGLDLLWIFKIVI